MTRPGTVRDALPLAKQRWAGIHPFDLDDQTWVSIFQRFNPCDILEAVSSTRHTYSRDPATIHQRFEYLLERLANKRHARY